MDSQCGRDGVCRFKGPKKRRQQRRNYRFDVFACALHSQCAEVNSQLLREMHEPVKSCLACEDFMKLEEPVQLEIGPQLIEELPEEESKSQYDNQQLTLNFVAVKPEVAIVIAARNNAPFLGEAIASAVFQTIPCEIVYSDDCSTDDSVRIAKQFERQGVTVLRSPAHHGVCETRNRGARATTAPYIIFLDGDDYLPLDFAEEHLKAIKAIPGTPLAYGPAKIVGNHKMAGHIYQVPPWEQYDLWQQNTCNTTSIYARWAFEAAGGWIDEPGTMWDWSMALRARRFGTPRPSKAILNYRHHGESWSDVLGEREDAADSIRQDIRKLVMRMTVGCVFSGRLPELIPEWCSRLARSIKWAALREPVEIVVMDNSPDDLPMGDAIENELLKYPDVFDRVKVIPHKARYTWSSEVERRNKVAEFMAHASNRIMDKSIGDVVWFVEDDILVPMNACKEMVEQLTLGRVPPEAVAGAYKNRHCPSRFVAGYLSEVVVKEYETLPGQPVGVNIAGTGCLMIWKDRPQMPLRFKSHVDGIPAHDWAWCQELVSKGGRIIFHPGVRCDHVASMDNIIKI